MRETHSYATPTSEQFTRARRQRLVSVFGDITRSGAWRPRPKTSAIAVFGDIELDLRQATLPPAGMRIGAIAPFGNLDIAVPSDAEVDVGGFTLFGSKKVAVDGTAPTETNTIITIRGFSFFGSMKVRSS
jgi:hypothetical protein